MIIHQALSRTLFLLALLFVAGLLPIGSQLTIFNKQLEALEASVPTITPKKTPTQWKVASLDASWSKRDAHVLVTFKDELWLIGGLEGNGHTRPDGVVEYWISEHKSDIWKTSDGVTWNLVTEKAPWGTRRSVTAVEFEGRLWVMGGWDNGPGGYNNAIWFSDDGIAWNKIQHSDTRWTPREGHTLVSYDNKLWLMGGVNFTTRTLFNDVWVSDDGMQWREVSRSAPWSPRYDHATSIFKNKIYTTGGKPLGNGNTYSDVWSSVDGKNWTLETENAWPSRHGHISLTYNNELWVIGGWHVSPEYDTGINDTWRSKDGVNWNRLPINGPWTGREDHMGEVFQGKMWLTGGMDADYVWSNDVWYLKY